MAFTNTRLGKKSKEEIIEVVSENYGKAPKENETATVGVKTETTEEGTEKTTMTVAATKYDVQNVKVAIPETEEKDYPSITILANGVPAND